MTYEYKCEKCNELIEINRPISEKEVIPECPNCKNNDLVKRVFGNSGIIFKGSGYYCTDSRT